MGEFKQKVKGKIYIGLIKYLIFFVILFIIGSNYAKVQLWMYKITKGKIKLDSINEYVDEVVEYPELETNKDDAKTDKKEVKQIQIEVNKKKFIATLYDNETAKDLVSMLPLEINMQELNGNEKFAVLQEDFEHVNHEKIGLIRQGDIMAYKYDRLVLFYKTFESEEEYSKIGYVEDVSGLEKALSGNDVDVVISIVK